jgi:hypothetical protein
MFLFWLKSALAKQLVTFCVKQVSKISNRPLTIFINLSFDETDMSKSSSILIYYFRAQSIFMQNYGLMLKLNWVELKVILKQEK